jgi:hypothetical protein
MNLKKLWPCLGLAVLAMSGCNKAEEPTTSAAPQASAAPRVDTARAGTVTGTVVFEGTPPVGTPTKVSSDPFCVRANAAGIPPESYIINNGRLENVVVYVKEGLGTYRFDMPAEPAKLDQMGCRYTPHVAVARVGQPIEISNSDDTLHNVHAMPRVNQEFNFAQALKGLKDQRTFTKPEVGIVFRCDVHPWMTSYVSVFDHPYYAISADGGKFTLKDVPPGTYTLEAWHERLGTQTQQVTLGEKESKDVTFTFKPAATP